MQEEMQQEEAAQPELPQIKNIDFGDISPEQQKAKERELVDKLIGKEFTIWETWRAPFESTWNQIYDLYFSNPSQLSKMPTRAKVFIPLVFQVIESTLPKIVNNQFNGEEFFDVVPTNPADEPLAESIKLLLNYQLIQADFFLKFIDFAKQLLFYGTSYFLTRWEVKRKWVFTRTPVRSAVKSFFGFVTGKNVVTDWQEIKEYKVVERRPDLDVVDILDVYPDPDARNEKDAKAVWIRSFVDLDELKELGMGQFPIYDNTSHEELKADAQAYTASRSARNGTRKVSAPNSGNKVELLSRWGLYDLDGDGIREETLIVIANRKVLLKAKANPFYHQKCPLIRSVLFPVPNEWYGVGLVEPVIPLQHEANTLRRQRLDNINLVINRMWVVKDGADIDLDTLISSPNGVIITNDLDALRSETTPDITQSNYIEYQTILSDIENTTISRAAQGVPESGRLGRTAGGARLIVGQALEKFVLTALLLQETAVKRVLRMFHQLDLQFIDDDETLRDPGMYGHLFDEQVQVEILKSEVSFRMQGIAEMLGKEAKINQAISFYSVFKDVLAIESSQYLAQKVAKLMGFDPKEINDIRTMMPIPGVTPTQDPMQAANDQAMAKQAMTNGTESQPSMKGVNMTPKGAI